MRLGQLSRKIGIQPSRISSFLEEKNYTLEAGSNSKLTDEQEALIKARFDYAEEEATPVADILETNAPTTDTLDANAPATDIPIVEEEATPEADSPKEKATSVVDTPIVEIVENDIPELVEEEATPVADTLPPVSDETSTEETTDEVIRAPKLKLDGLKVVGKIDLPEPKVKEETATAVDSSDSKDDEVQEEEVKEKPVRRKINNPKNYNRRPQKRTLTLEEKQERAERTRKRKNKAEKEKQKQLKTAYYESKMREQQPAASKKNKRKAVRNEPQEFDKVTQPAPKTILGKFLRWLNT